MKRIAIVIIVAGVLYFLGGFLAVQIGWMSGAVYLQYSGPVGGIASVAGLLGLLGQRISARELKRAELDAIEGMVSASKQLRETESRLAETTGQIERLQVQRDQMEVLVKKASLSLFYRDQYVRRQDELRRLVERNDDLQRVLHELRDIEYKISALDEEIAADPDVTEIRSFIADVELETSQSPDFESIFEAIAHRIVRLIRPIWW